MDIFDLFAKLTLDSSEYEKGLGQAQKDAGSFANKLKTGLATAGKVGAAALGAVTAAAGLMTKSILAGTKEVAAYGDNIDKASQKMGISAQAYQEWDAILQHSGTSIESMRNGMQKLTLSVTKGTDAQKEAWKKLGTNVATAAEEMNAEERFSYVITALQKIEDETERTALAQTLLGGSSKELGALLNTSAEDTEAMRQRVHELGGVMSNEAVKAAAKYQDSLQDFQTAVSGVKRSITTEFLPSVTSVMDGLTEIFAGDSEGGLAKLNEGIDQFVDNLTGLLQKVVPIGASVVTAVGSAILDNIDTLIDVGADLVLQLVDGIVLALPNVVKAGVRIITKFATSISKNIKPIMNAVTSALTEIIAVLTSPDVLPDLISAGIEMLLALVDGLIGALPKLIEAIPVLIEGLLSAISQNLPMLIQAGIQIAQTLMRSLIDNLPVLIDAAIQILLTLVDALTDPDNIVLLVEGAFQLIIALGAGLIEALPKLIEKIPDIIVAIVTALVNGAGNLLEAGGTLIDKLWEGIKNCWEDIKKWGGEIIDKIWEGITSTWEDVKDWAGKIWAKIKDGTLWDDIKAWGADLIDKIWEGIKSCWPTVKTWAGKIFVKVVEGASTAWESIKNIGKDIVRGIWDGINSMWSWITDKIGGFFDGLIDSAKGVLGIASPSKVFAALGGFTAEGFGEGFDKAFSAVSRDVQTQMDSLADHPLDFDTQISSHFGTNSSSGSLANSMNELLAVLTEIRDKEMTVVLDDGTLIGRVDKALGQTALWKARGNA